jgi:6-phosphofructokinase 1
VRAVAQAAFSRGWEVVGIEGGFGGILEGDLRPIDRQHVGGLMHRAGTMLGSGRSKEVRTDEGQERAARSLEEAGVGGLVVIGGGGSLTSAKALGEAGVRAVGIPATIDNDVRRCGGALAEDGHGTMVGIRGERVERVPLEEVVGKERQLDPEMYRLAEILAGMPE